MVFAKPLVDGEIYKSLFPKCWCSSAFQLHLLLQQEHIPRESKCRGGQIYSNEATIQMHWHVIKAGGLLSGGNVP